MNMLKIALVRPTILKKKESQQLSTAASLLLSGVETQLVPSEKELEVINSMISILYLCV